VKIAVCLKRVPDTATRVRIGGDGKSIDPADVQYIISPYDEFALEEALLIREKAGEGEVTVITVGPEAASKEVRTALGMGADAGVIIQAEVALDPRQIACALVGVLKDRGDALILFGRQSVDSQGAQVAALVAREMSLPFVNDIISLEIDGAKVRVGRDTDGGREVIECPLPAILGCDKGLNDPRYPSLKGIMAARKKPVETVEAQPVEASLETIELSLPPARPEGKIVGEGPDAVSELVRLLREEAKVI